MRLTILRASNVSGVAPAIDAILDCFSHFGVQEAVEKSDGKSLEMKTEMWESLATNKSSLAFPTGLSCETFHERRLISDDYVAGEQKIISKSFSFILTFLDEAYQHAVRSQFLIRIYWWWARVWNDYGRTKTSASIWYSSWLWISKIFLILWS